MVDLIAADKSTKANLGTDLAVYGTIDTAGDVDWYRIHLNPGNYQVNLIGDGFFGSALTDTIVRIYNDAGTQIAVDDDDGTDSNSYIDFSITSGGTYYISAGAFSAYTGDYALSVFTNNADIPLEIGTSQTTRADTGYEQDTFTATLVQGVSYTLKMEPQPGINNANSVPITPLNYMMVRFNDPDGNEVDRGHSTTVGETVTITFTAAKNGEYDFITYGYLNSSQGHYSFSLTTTNPPRGHRPEGGDATATAQEDTAFAGFTPAMFPYSDADSSAFGGITITSLPSSGSLVLGSSVIGVGQIVTKAGLANLRYVPAANVNGSVSFGYTVYELTPRLANDLSPNTFTLDIVSVNDAPVITSNGGAASVQFDINENIGFQTTVSATDVDSAITYGLIGADAALFAIDATTGVVTLKAAPDYETPRDAGGNNVYDVSVIATDGSASAVQQLSVIVHNAPGNTITGTKKDDTVDASHGINTKTATYEEDRIDGKKGNDKLDGLSGNDTLIGGAGKDTLIGGAGFDRLDGGKDGDQFRFSAKLAVASIDTIVKFEHDKDKIALDDKVFKAIGSSLSADEFYAKAGATTAKDKSDHIIYNKTTGDLYYDKDGKGGAAAVHFATLANHPGSLDHGDFTIV